MNRWELWKFPFPSEHEPHWFVILSPQAFEMGKGDFRVNGLYCATFRPGHVVKPYEVRLNGADGLHHDTIVKCHFVFSLPTSAGREKRGPVSRAEGDKFKRS